MNRILVAAAIATLSVAPAFAQSSPTGRPIAPAEGNLISGKNVAPAEGNLISGKGVAPAEGNLISGKTPAPVQK